MSHGRGKGFQFLIIRGQFDIAPGQPPAAGFQSRSCSDNARMAPNSRWISLSPPETEDGMLASSAIRDISDELKCY